MKEQGFRGIGACSGIGTGRVQVVDRRRLSVPHYHVPPESLDAEIERLERAISTSEAQLTEIQERAEDSGLGDATLLLEAHRMVLRDHALVVAAQDHIRNGQINAEWALSKAIKKIREIFDGLDADFFRERRSDVDLVGDRVLRNLVGEKDDVIENVREDSIIVAYDLSPADTVALARYQVRGFVTETGGRTSHTAIVAKAMNVPAVLGAHGVMEAAGTGDPIVMDGVAGEVILHPEEATCDRYRVLERRRAIEREALLADRHLPAETTDGRIIKLLGNIEVKDEIEAVFGFGGEGIGLYRSEFLVIELDRMPTAEEHAAEYSKIVGAVGEAELTIRTIDIGGDKFVRSGTVHADTSQDMLNPALGLRALRYSLRDRETFREQLCGILKASALGQVRLLLPFVTTVDEVRQSKQVLREAMAALDAEGHAYDKQLPVGIMVETPAAVWMADSLAQEVDFFSVGTNDLVQYSLAVDRGNEDVADLYRPCDPAVVRSLNHLCQVAHRADVPVAVCGEMAADPFMAPLLLGLGVGTLSMSATSIPLVKRLIRSISHSACVDLVSRVLLMGTAEEVESELAAAHRRWEPMRRSSSAARARSDA